MRITILNLWGFFDWNNRKDHIIDYLRSINPDVVLFQEVVFLPEESPFTQAKQIIEALGMPYRHESITRLQKSPHYAAYREGLTAASRHPIVATESYTLPQDARDEHQRIIQLVDVQDPSGDILKLANIHLSVTDKHDFAMPQLKMIIKALAYRNEQRILAGDFNIHGMHGLHEHRKIWEPAYRLCDTKEYISFPETDDRLDYFIVPQHHKTGHPFTSSDGLSDHRAVSIDILSI